MEVPDGIAGWARPLVRSLLAIALLATCGHAWAADGPGATPAAPAPAATPVAPASAAAPSPIQAQSDRCTRAIAAAEAKYSLPAGLLLAIAKTESGRPIAGAKGLQPWPWAVDSDGRAYYFDSKEAAVNFVRTSGGGQVDVGCMQINLQAHSRAFPSLEVAFDPDANAEYGGRFFRRLFDETANWYTAVGFYHSRTPDLATSYRDRVRAVAEGREPPASALFQPLYLRAISQGTLRLSLVGGGVLRINLNRQPRAPNRRRASPCEVVAALGPYIAAPAATRGCRQR